MYKTQSHTNSFTHASKSMHAHIYTYINARTQTGIVKGLAPANLAQ